MATRKPVFTACVELNDLIAVNRARKEPWWFLAAMVAPYAGEDDALEEEALFRHFDKGDGHLEDDCFIIRTGNWAYGFFVTVAPGHVEARVTVIRHKTIADNAQDQAAD